MWCQGYTRSVLKQTKCLLFRAQFTASCSRGSVIYSFHPKSKSQINTEPWSLIQFTRCGLIQNILWLVYSACFSRWREWWSECRSCLCSGWWRCGYLPNSHIRLWNQFCLSIICGSPVWILPCGSRRRSKGSWSYFCMKCIMIINRLWERCLHCNTIKKLKQSSLNDESLFITDFLWYLQLWWYGRHDVFSIQWFQILGSWRFSSYFPGNFIHFRTQLK